MVIMIYHQLAALEPSWVCIARLLLCREGLPANLKLGQNSEITGYGYIKA
jgi:hypothetical protein